MLLRCGHSYCAGCLSGQLAARWPGPRVTFGYLQCGLCRAPLEHEAFEEKLAEHARFQQRVAQVAADAFREDGAIVESLPKLGREATEEEVVAHASEAMVVYMCSRCREPYCAGRQDCAAQQEMSPEELLCRACVWSLTSAAADRRCQLHGPRFALYKCDYCCAVATYCCGGTYMCTRCHDPWDFPPETAEEAAERRRCPGPGRCPLGIPHPSGATAFVIGCTACAGYCEPQDDFDLDRYSDYDSDYDPAEEFWDRDAQRQERDGHRATAARRDAKRLKRQSAKEARWSSWSNSSRRWRGPSAAAGRGQRGRQPPPHGRPHRRGHGRKVPMVAVMGGLIAAAELC